MKGKKHLIIFLFPLALCALLSSCEDCYKCGINQPEPYFNVKFFNARQLHLINDSIEQVDDKSIELNTILLQSNKFLNLALDSLENTEDPIAIGSLEHKVDSVEVLIENTNKSLNNFKATKTKLGQVKRKIESGAVPLESITSPEGKKIAYVPEDSLTSYKFPLPMNDTFAQYFIHIKDSTYSLQVAYTKEQVVENGSVVIKAHNLSLLSATNLDSIEINYRNDLRKTNETYFYLYF